MEGNQLLQPRPGNISVPMGVIAAVNQDLQRAALRREDGTYSVIVYQDSWQLVVGERVAGSAVNGVDLLQQIPKPWAPPTHPTPC